MRSGAHLCIQHPMQILSWLCRIKTSKLAPVCGLNTLLQSHLKCASGEDLFRCMKAYITMGCKWYAGWLGEKCGIS